MIIPSELRELALLLGQEGDVAHWLRENGSSILFKASDTAEGPAKAGRAGDRIRELPCTVQDSLRQMTELAQAAVRQLRQAGPDKVTTIEFGVDMAAEVGAVIAKTETGCHLSVTITWRRADPPGAA